MAFQFSSINKKQVVAVTGVLLVVYIIAHLGGNLLIYAGPDVFNGYSKMMHSFLPFLRFIEYSLLAVFLIHISFTAMVVMENIKARGGLNRYAVDKAVGKRSLATRIMPWTGLYILLFVVWHIYDFTLVDHEGPRSMIAGQHYGIYGVVVNAFTDPFHSILYVIAVTFLGFHLAHGVESSLQTMGIKDVRRTAAINAFSRYFAIVIVLGFSSIPLYVYLAFKAVN